MYDDIKYGGGNEIKLYTIVYKLICLYITLYNYTKLYIFLFNDVIYSVGNDKIMYDCI